jgi:hypothetical protein
VQLIDSCQHGDEHLDRSKLTGNFLTAQVTWLVSQEGLDVISNVANGPVLC